MSDTPKIIPEEINLFHIDILEHQIAQPKVKLYIDVAHTVMHNLKEEKVKLNLKINLETCKGDNKKCPFAHFNIDFHYQIKNLENFYTLNNNQQPTFNALLIVTLLGISFSTARGIIYEKLTANSIKNIILPVVSPQKLLIKTNNQNR